MSGFGGKIEWCFVGRIGDQDEVIRSSPPRPPKRKGASLEVDAARQLQCLLQVSARHWTAKSPRIAGGFSGVPHQDSWNPTWKALHRRPGLNSLSSCSQPLSPSSIFKTFGWRSDSIVTPHTLSYIVMTEHVDARAPTTSEPRASCQPGNLDIEIILVICNGDRGLGKLPLMSRSCKQPSDLPAYDV